MMRNSVPAMMTAALRGVAQPALPAVLVLLLAACGGGGTADEPAAGQDQPVVPAAVADDARVQTDDETLLALVNAARAQARRCGEVDAPAVAALRLNATIKQAALEQANWVRETDSLSHTGRAGSTPGQRLTATGYAWGAVGENLARGYQQLGDVVQAWLASPGHCMNIMHAGFTEVGFQHLPAQEGKASVTAMVSATPG